MFFMSLLKGGIKLANNISITVRLPRELNVQLATVARDIGMTKTNLIRSAIHDFLSNEDFELEFSNTYEGKPDRLVLNVNKLTHDILENACKKYSQSMNAVITAVSILALERSAKWLQSTQK